MTGGAASLTSSQFDADVEEISAMAGEWSSMAADLSAVEQRLGSALSILEKAGAADLMASEYAPLFGATSIFSIVRDLKNVVSLVGRTQSAARQITGELGTDAQKLLAVASNYASVDSSIQAQLQSLLTTGIEDGANGSTGAILSLLSSLNGKEATVPTPAPAPPPVPAPPRAKSVSPPTAGGDLGGVGVTGGSRGGGTGTAGPATVVPNTPINPPGPAQYANQAQVTQWVNQAFAVLEAHGVPASALNINDVMLIIQHESSGNPNAINLWDSNAQAGDPSRGLMQTIGTTFNEYALPGYNTNIYNPVDNIIAGCRYALATYGSLANVPGVKAVNSGGTYVGY